MASLNKSFFFLLLLLLPSFSICQRYKNVTRGSSLTALNNNNGSYWSSPSGEFAFGFLQFGSKGFLLAIWFNKIPEKTVVWSANRNDLAPEGSIVQLTERGQLVLNGPGATQIWDAKLADNVGSVSYAAMLDTGNFILAAPSNDSQVLWQTFAQPTDTILPSQTLNANLIASYSETNYSEGRFRFSMGSNGNLVSTYPKDIPMRQTHTVYWESKTADSESQLVFNISGSIFISAVNGSVVKTLTSNTPSTKDFYHRAVLDFDGVFRQYVYPKITPSPWPKAWSQVSNSIPSDICVTINNGLGSGVCGFNSYCSLGDNQRPICSCPHGYENLDPNDPIKGCKPSFVPQSCNDDDDSLSEIDAFEFSSIENSDWPSSDYEAFSGVDEDWCRRVCLEDCNCAAIVYRGTECWKKKYPLSFGRIDLGFAGKALIKVRKDNSTLTLVNPVQKATTKDKTLVVIGSILLGTCGFLIATSFIAYQFNIKRRKLNNVEEMNSPVLGLNLRVFSYDELNKATSGFKQQLGSGAFATVYKGTVDYCHSTDNNLVAVKKLDNAVKEGDQVL